MIRRTELDTGELHCLGSRNQRQRRGWSVEQSLLHLTVDILPPAIPTLTGTGTCNWQYRDSYSDSHIHMEVCGSRDNL